jgi:hypothetical protein
MLCASNDKIPLKALEMNINELLLGRPWLGRETGRGNVYKIEKG